MTVADKDCIIVAHFPVRETMSSKCHAKCKIKEEKCMEAEADIGWSTPGGSISCQSKDFSVMLLSWPGAKLPYLHPKGQEKDARTISNFHILFVLTKCFTLSAFLDIWLSL